MIHNQRNLEPAVIIVGQGLAGSVLAWRLAERGLRPVVIDRGATDALGRPSASSVAAGLITPITGRRMALSREWQRHWTVARDFYRDLEARTGRSLLLERPSVRVLRNSQERDQFMLRLEEPDFSKRVRVLDRSEIPAGLVAEHGAFEMIEAARLDVAGFLGMTRDWLIEQQGYHALDLDMVTDIVLHRDRVEVSRLSVGARLLVLCAGTEPNARWPQSEPTAPTRGEILDLSNNEGWADQRVTHGGVWAAPREGGGLRVGATHDRERLDCGPTERGESELRQGLHEFLPHVSRVVRREAALRPSTRDREPIVGFSEADPRVGWLNGLGAKGSLLGPALAAGLAAECEEKIGRLG